MDIKKDKKNFIDLMYDKYERFNVTYADDKEFIIGIDHYNVSIDIHYIRNLRNTLIYIEYYNRVDGYRSKTHMYEYANNMTMNEADYEKIFYRFVLAVSDAVTIYNVDLLNPHN